jgi:hypothetical protein
MDWAGELREAFDRLCAGQEARVEFSARTDRVGTLGQEFNALAVELEGLTVDDLTRERAHGLRNRLAGILAALHVLRMSNELTREEQTALEQVVESARQLDERFRKR